MAGYTHKGVDLDEIFEPLLPGDPTHPTSVGLVDSSGKDATELYVALVGGAKIPENVMYQQQGMDFRDIFAAKGTVSRFLKPLPWDRTINQNLTIYRQKSRPLVTTMKIRVYVSMDGKVQITASKPNRHSDPASVADEVIYTLTDPAAWNMQYIPANTFFEIKFDITSNNGSNPSGTILFGTWVAMDGTPAGAEFTNQLQYLHDTMVDGDYNKNTNIRISIRRSDLPDNIKTDAITYMNLNLTVLADLFTDPSPWTANLSTAVSNNLPQYPEAATGNYSVTTEYQVKGNGTIVVKRSISDKNGAGPYQEIVNMFWRRGLTADDTTANDFEVKFTSGVGVTFNGAQDWVSLEAGTTVSLIMQHAVANNSAPGNYSQNSAGSITIRQKSTKGFVALDNFVSGAVAASTSIVIGQPIMPDWTGMTLPDITLHRDVDIDHSKPARWESSGAKYLMGMSNSLTGKNVIGRTFQQTTDNIQNPTEPVIEIDKVLTRITPDGWNPSWFEWRYRILDGQVDGGTPNVWRNMIDATYGVQVSASINHGTGPGTYGKFASLAIDVRRVAAPQQTYTFTTRLEASVKLISNGPNWGSIFLPDHSTTVRAGANQVSYSDYDVCSTGYLIAVNDAGFNSFVSKHSFFGTDIVPDEIHNELDARFTPNNWAVNDLEWKYEIVSEVNGSFINNYYTPGPVLAPNTWANIGDMKYVAFYTGSNTPRNVGEVLIGVGKMRVTVRVKSQPAMSFTYEPVTFTNRIEYVTPPFTLWPREAYQNWAGTYYHTSTHEGGGSATTAWQTPFVGITVNTSAVWTFTFNSNGDWLWEGNGLVQYEQNGQWLPNIVAGSGANYSIRVIDPTGMVATSSNISSTWQKMNVARYISITAIRPPAGEPDNNRWYKATIEIRDDITGQIYQSGPIELLATAENR